jgi:hypothetical protein
MKPAAVALHNTGNLSICVNGAPGQRMNRRQRRTLRWLYRRAHKRLPHSHRPSRPLSDLKVWVHYQWPDNNTQCPDRYAEDYLALAK